MKTPHTTTFRIKGDDFFVADLDNGGLRIGLKGTSCLDVPVGHPMYARIDALKTEAEAEEFFYDVASPIILAG